MFAHYLRKFEETNMLRLNIQWKITHLSVIKKKNSLCSILGNIMRNIYLANRLFYNFTTVQTNYDIVIKNNTKL